MKKYNNKGFSLVELIVVVAIMAVLMAVLVPTLIRNVEKTRVQKDKSAIAEIHHSTELAIADEEYLNATVSTTSVSRKSDTLISRGLESELPSRQIFIADRFISPIRSFGW